MLSCKGRRPLFCLFLTYLLVKRKRGNTELQTIRMFKAQLHIKTHRRTILTNPLHKMWQKDTQPSRKRATGTKRQKPAAVKVPIFLSKFHSSNRYIISNITVNLKTLIYQQSICEINITLIPHCFEGLLTTRYIMLHLWMKLWSNNLVSGLDNIIIWTFMLCKVIVKIHICEYYIISQ